MWAEGSAGGDRGADEAEAVPVPMLILNLVRWVPGTTYAILIANMYLVLRTRRVSIRPQLPLTSAQQRNFAIGPGKETSSPSIICS